MAMGELRKDDNKGHDQLLKKYVYTKPVFFQL